MADKKENTKGLQMDRDAIIAMTRKMAGGNLRKNPSGSRAAPRVNSSKTDFSTLKIFQQMETQRAVADLAGLANPYFQLQEGRAGPTTRIGGREYINFSSYDYLGLNAHADVEHAAEDAIKFYGTSVSASRPTAGNRPLHRKLEKQFATLYHAEDALTFVSGHSTNVSTIGDLMEPGDLVLFDALSHNSITVGAKLSGAARRRYGHNDLDELEKILTQTRRKYNRVLIVVEGLYSMDGDIPDLPRLVEIKNRHEAWLMVDDAHALGVLGRTGRGVFEHFGVNPADVDIWMGTLSKTLSGCGGYIAGNRPLIEILKYFASGFMFSVGMSPPVVAAASRSLEIMLDEPDRVARLHKNGRLFLETAKRAGLDTGLSEGFSIVPVIVGDSLRTVKLCNLLFEHGIFTIPVTYPAVPMQEARIRFFITSEHTKEQLQKAINITSLELKRLDEENFGLGSLAGSSNGAGT
jgi:8-amino-7-oxononanoate synthase